MPRRNALHHHRQAVGPASRLFVVLPFAQQTAFTGGCGLVRHSVSSPGTTGSVVWRRATLVPHSRSGSAANVIRCSPREPTLVQGRRWVVVAWKDQCEYDGGWGIPGPIFGLSGADQAPCFPGALHDRRKRFLVPAGSRSQRVLSEGPT